MQDNKHARVEENANEILSYAAAFKLNTRQIDIRISFLNAPLSESSEYVQRQKLFKKKQSLCRADENHKFEEMQASGRTESKMSRTNKKNRLLDK
ncbi:hypothetical protein DERF_012138 [Dermatophagoides farinae]|uniref:Uncharacterized protein n=1 Tax=Dermatophagoides farinae TaxID=6954 RepID=A0A922HPF2_DERFA|nr:hypothetical protein DERF_012138 [Dermatophagoides farinae]